MPRYVSPGRTPSPSRSPSRSSSRGYTYTDGVYTPTGSDSRSRSPSPLRSRSRRPGRGRSTGRSTSRADSYYSRSPSRSPSRSRSRSTARTSGMRSRLSALDTSSSTGKEKAENVVKTSLVMLGAIGAASLAAHKFWPRGITYGDKEDWETEKKKEEKGKAKQEIRERLREGKDAMSGRRDDDYYAARGSSSGGGRGERAGRDPSRERRERYLQERLQERRRERLALPAAVSGEPGVNYWESRDMKRSGRRYDDDHDDYDDYPREDPRNRRYSAADLPPQRRQIQRRIETTAPLPPAPNPPGHYSDEPAPPPPAIVVPAASSRRGTSDRSQEGRGGYYVEGGSTIVLPSLGEREYVIRREAPPGQRLRVRDGERDDAYYR